MQKHFEAVEICVWMWGEIMISCSPLLLHTQYLLNVAAAPYLSGWGWVVIFMSPKLEIKNNPSKSEMMV